MSIVGWQYVGFGALVLAVVVVLIALIRARRRMK